MARIRTVKPDFFRHELLQDLEITYPGKCPMLVFAGLFGHCDKAGHFEWKPRMLKLDILPFMSFDMAETLTILEHAKLLRKYVVDGAEYGEIPSFTEHQRISGKEAQEPEKHPRPQQETKGKIRRSAREAPETAGREGKGREGNGVMQEGSQARREPVDNSPTLENLPLREGGEFPVRQSLVDELTPLYPAVDIPATLREMKGWLVLNVDRRKTRRGIRRFIGNWLQGEQEKHGS